MWGEGDLGGDGEHYLGLLCALYFCLPSEVGGGEM